VRPYRITPGDTPAAAVEAALISDATATLTCSEQSVADSGPDGDDGSAVQSAASNHHAVKMGSPIKLKPKTLVFRRRTRYYNSMWAID